MKYLKYLLLALLLLVLFILVKAMLTKSISYESQVSVNKSAKEAWAVMQDESTLPKWIEGFKKTELVSGTKGAPGAVSTIYLDQGGQEMTMTESITNVIPEELMAMNFSMDFMDMDYEMTLNEEGDKTLLKSTTTVLGNGMWQRIMVSFMKGAMKKQEDINIGKLQKLINENKKDYFPAPAADVIDAIEIQPAIKIVE